MRSRIRLSFKVYRGRVHVAGLLQAAIFVVRALVREGFDDVLAEPATKVGFVSHDGMCFVEAQDYRHPRREDEDGAEEIWKSIGPIAHPSHAVLATNYRVRAKDSWKRSDWVCHEPAPVGSDQHFSGPLYSFRRWKMERFSAAEIGVVPLQCFRTSVHENLTVLNTWPGDSCACCESME